MYFRYQKKKKTSPPIAFFFFFFYFLTLLLSFNASIISLPLTLLNEDANVFVVNGTFLLLTPLTLLLEWCELIDDDLRLNILNTKKGGRERQKKKEKKEKEERRAFFEY